MELADSAKVRGAEERHPVVATPVELAPAAFLQAKAGETRIVGQAPRRRIRRHVEAGAIVEDLAGAAALRHMHADGPLEEAAEMEERDRVRARPVRPQGELGPEADLAVDVVVDRLEDVRRRPGRGRVAGFRQVARPPLQPLEAERGGRAELQPLRRQRGSVEAEGGERPRGGGAGQQEAAVDHVTGWLVAKVRKGGGLRRQSCRSQGHAAGMAWITRSTGR